MKEKLNAKKINGTLSREKPIKGISRVIRVLTNYVTIIIITSAQCKDLLENLHVTLVMI